MNFVKCRVIVVLDPEGDGPQEFVVLHELHIADGVDLFTPTDDLIGTVVVDEFQQV
jgi:hypothetical protein